MSTPDAEKIALYQSMAASDPGNVLLKLNLYDLYHRAGQFDEAAAGFAELLDDEEYKAVARNNLAQVRLSQQQFDEAESLLRELIDEGDQSPALYHNLGIALYCQRDWIEAQHAFEAARDCGLSTGNNLRYLAFSLHQQKRPGEAREIIQQWLESDPSDDAVGYLSVLELDLGHRDAAQQTADEALRINPENIDATYVKSIGLLEKQDMDQAERLLLRVLDKQPKSHRALQGLGMVYYYRQDFDKAIRFLERAQVVSPKQIGTLIMIGWAHVSKQDVKSAEKAFRRAIAVEPNFGESHGGLATTLALQKRVDEAQREITVARRLDKRSFGATYAHSILIALQGKKDRAEKLIERALRQPVDAGAPSIEESLTNYFRHQGIGPPAEAEHGTAADD